MKPYRAFLTGEPGCGKTTALKKACDILVSRGRKIGGVLSGEIRERGVRVGFSVQNVASGETGILAHINQNEGPSVGKYRVNLADIDRVAVSAIKHAVVDADIVVVDELGPMELNSRPFVTTVETALGAPKPFLGTIHKRASHSLVTAIKSNKAYEIVEVTIENRDSVPRNLVQKIEE